MSSLPSLESSAQVTFTHGSMIRLTGLPPAVVARICDALTISNPKYAAAVRFSGWHPRNIEKKLYGFRSIPKEPPTDGTYSIDIAPGFAAAAWGICKAQGISPRFEGARFPDLLEPIPYSGENRDYQDETLMQVGSRYGVLVAPCGSGKTDMGIRLMLDRNCRFLIIVHTTDLMEQWHDRINERTGENAFLIGGSSKLKPLAFPGERFIIATIQTLIRHPTLVDELNDSRDGVLIDECHHTPSTTFTKVLARMAPAYRFGITATLERNDGLTDMIHWWIGPVLAKLPQETLEKSGHVMRPKLEVLTSPSVHIEHDPSEPGDYLRVMKEICADEDRAKCLAYLILERTTGPRFHLVLAGTIDYGMKLYHLLKGRPSLNVAVFNGKTPKKERTALLASANRGEIDVIIATTVADEGLDIPNLTDVWLATPLRAAGRIQQRLGRVCRPREGKEQPIIHDIVDTGIWRYKYIEKSPDWTEARRTKRFTFIEQFRHRFNKVYRRLCDYDDASVKAVLGK